jgi:hypothetical protein
MSNPQTQQQPLNLQIRYEDMTARYANQALVSTTAEEVYLDFSSGIIMDRGAGAGSLPIHTRIVMNPNGMLRLYQAIGQALQNYQIVRNAPAPAPEAPQPVQTGESQGGEGGEGGENPQS